MSKATIPPTTEFVSMIVNDEVLLKQVYPVLPEIFVNQAKDGYNKFYLDKYLVSNAQYTGLERGENSPTDYFRLTIIDPEIVDENTLQLKIQLSALINRTNGVIKLFKKEYEPPTEDETWLPGFYSPLIIFTRDDLSERDFNNLVDYAILWKAHNKDLKKGETSPFFISAKKNGGLSNKKLFFAAANEDFSMKFLMCLRKSNEGVYTIGMTDISLENVMVIGADTSQRAVEAKAEDVKLSKKKVELELPTRVAKSTTSSTSAKNLFGRGRDR